jgi:hypothetical protein
MRKALRLVAILAAFGLTVWIGVVAAGTGLEHPNPIDLDDDVPGSCGWRRREGQL